MTEARTPSTKPRGKNGRRLFTKGAWIALGILVPVAVLCFNVGRSWFALRKEMATQTADVSAVRERNAFLEPISDVLRNTRFQICNRGAYQVKVTWLLAAFHDGKQVKTFDSAACREWSDPILAPGEAKFMTLSTAEQGCNWNGAVMYYAMRLYRRLEDEERILERPYDYVDVYTGYDRDCFTLQ